MSELLKWFERRRETKVIVPETLKKADVQIAEGVRECVSTLRKTINSMMEKLEGTLEQAADACEEACDQIGVIIVRR